MRNFFKNKIIPQVRFRTPTPNERNASIMTLLLVNLPGVQAWETGTVTGAFFGVFGFCGIVVCCALCCGRNIAQDNQQQNHRQPLLAQSNLQEVAVTGTGSSASQQTAASR